MLFRRTDKYGYSRYYGSGGPALVIKIIVAILAVVVIVLGLITFGLQKYMVYTENGGHLELPWQNKNPGTSDVDPLPLDGDTSADGSASADGSGTAEPDTSVPVVEEPDQEEPTQVDEKLEPLPGDLLVQHVSVSDVLNDHAPGTLEDADANGIMLFMKESGGTLNYHADLEMSNTLSASISSGQSNTIANVVDDLNKEDYYTLAYLNGFDDAKLSALEEHALLNTEGETWTDSNDVGWANPADEAVQEYLVGVVSDMADMGFDEVVLYDGCFPWGDGADTVDLEGVDTEAVITAFYQKLAAVAKEKKVLVSVVADPAAILGQESTSGQTLENLKSLGGRVWVMTDQTEDPDALNEALTKAGFAENSLGLVSESLERDTGYSHLNLD